MFIKEGLSAGGRRIQIKLNLFATEIPQLEHEPLNLNREREIPMQRISDQLTINYQTSSFIISYSYYELTTSVSSVSSGLFNSSEA